MKLLTAILALFICGQSYAQSYNFSQIAEMHFIEASLFDDFNNDGIIDVLAINYNLTTQLIFFEGTGSAELESRFKQTFSIEIPDFYNFFFN